MALGVSPRAESVAGPRRGGGAGRGRVPPAGSPHPFPPERSWWNSRAGEFGWDALEAAGGSLRVLPNRAGAEGRCPAPSAPPPGTTSPGSSLPGTSNYR